MISVKENSSKLDLTKSAINDIYNEGSDEYKIINGLSEVITDISELLINKFKTSV